MKSKIIFSIKDLAITFGVLIIASLVALLLQKISKHNFNIPIVYFMSIVVISAFTNGYLYGILGSVIGVFAVNYYFTYPINYLNFILEGYPIAFLSMLIVSIITCTLTSRIKEQAAIAIAKQNLTNTLFLITKELLVTRGIENIYALTINYVEGNFKCQAFLYTDSSIVQEECDLSEMAVADWAFTHKEIAGNDTENFGDAKGIYIPIMTEERVFGVLCILPLDSTKFFDDEKIVIQMIVDKVAMALERQRLSDEQHVILLNAEKEKMRSNLLRSISHDLRTPLTGILGASSAILENGDQIDKKTHDTLLNDIREDSQWLIRMVENLLSITRIGDNATKIVKRAEAVEEIVAEAVGRIKTNYQSQKIKVSVPDELLFVPMDATLIEQVIINLIENAIKHSGKPCVIEVSVKIDENNAIFTVSDNGNGILDDDLPYLFEGYTLKQSYITDSTRGMGIGLSICKSIIAAHSGNISAKNKQTGGAEFSFSLPIMEDTYE